MLTGISISNYRGFKEYSVQGLNRVNLFGGKNNSGKTALLEAIHLLVSGGLPDVLMSAASRRGEFVLGAREGPVVVDLSHLFYGHEIRESTKFTLQSQDGVAPVSVEVVPLEDVEEPQEAFDLGRGSLMAAFALHIGGPRGTSKSRGTLLLSEEGALIPSPQRPMRRYQATGRLEDPSIAFIGPELQKFGLLSTLWDDVLRDKREPDVRRALQILEPNLEDIVFQPGDLASRMPAGRSGVLVGFAGDDRRVPLSSMGDGMFRMLALSISLIHAKGGYLLVDEIDTGLHYSVMADMWKLVVETAVEHDIQVFATTHSKDCYKGLAAVCKEEPEKSKFVAVHKVDCALAASVPSIGKNLVRAIEGGVELR